MAPAQVRIAVCRRSRTSGANRDGTGRHVAGYRSETECDVRYDHRAWRRRRRVGGAIGVGHMTAGPARRPPRLQRRRHRPAAGPWDRKRPAHPGALRRRCDPVV